MICKQCGTVFRGEQVLPGSGWIELVLYIAYVFPGVIYSIWRRSRRHPTCAACGSRDLVGAQTPVGQKLAKEFYPDGIPAAPAAVPRAPTAADRIVHRVTLGLVWFLVAIVVLTFGTMMVVSWLA